MLGGLASIRVGDGADQFADDVSRIFKPLLKLRVERALLYEDVEAAAQMKASGFTQLNARVSYSVYAQGSLQLHLASSYERKDEIEDMYVDGLHKVFDIVRGNPEIATIGGSSWLNATRTYGDMKRRLGFELVDTDPDIVSGYFATKDRPVKDAVISRERFLEIYGGGA